MFLGSFPRVQALRVVRARANSSCAVVPGGYAMPHVEVSAALYLCQDCQLKAGTIKAHEAAELANVAGKMIASAKVQVEYYALTDETPRIDFLKDDNEEGGAA